MGGVDPHASDAALVMCDGTKAEHVGLVDVANMPPSKSCKIVICGLAVRLRTRAGVAGVDGWLLRRGERREERKRKEEGREGRIPSSARSSNFPESRVAAPRGMTRHQIGFTRH